MKNKLKYIYLSIVATLIFVFTFTLVNTKTYAYTYNSTTDTITSDNLIQLNDKTINASGYFYNKEELNNSLNQGTYSLSFIYTGGQYIQIGLYNNNNEVLFNQIISGINGLNLIENFTLNDIATKITIFTNNTEGGTISNIMLNTGTTAKNYEPYGTYINENVYNDYVATHSYTNTEYQDLQTQITNLQSQYNSLLQQYNDYVATHSYTNTEYQDLQTQITNLQSQYENLLLQYDTLNQDYNILYNSNSIGWFSFINEIGYLKTVSPITTETQNLNYLMTNNYIVGDTFNIGEFVEDNSTPNFNITQILFEQQKVLLEELNFTINNYSDFGSLRVQIYNPYDELHTTQEVQWDFQTYGNVINERSLVSALTGHVLSDAEWEEYLEYTSIRDFTSVERLLFYNFTSYTTTIITNSSVDGQSYIKGFSAGLASQNLNYNQARQDYQRLLLEKTDIQSQYNSLKNDYVALSTLYNSLQDSYNNYVNGDNFASLFFTIAETPFASFKQIWNVDFLGVNLSGFVTGLLFIGLLIWLVKKIF